MVSAAAVDVDVVATTLVVVAVALATPPNEVYDDAVGIAIATTNVARVAPSSKAHKNSITIKILLAVAVVSLY